MAPSRNQKVKTIHRRDAMTNSCFQTCHEKTLRASSDGARYRSGPAHLTQHRQTRSEPPLSSHHLLSVAASDLWCQPSWQEVVLTLSLVVGAGEMIRMEEKEGPKESKDVASCREGGSPLLANQSQTQSDAQLPYMW